MSSKNNLIFKSLHVVAWIIFVGLCIEAGALLVNFAFSLFKPEFISRLYQKLDLSSLYRQSSWVFFGMYGFILVIAILKAVLFYIVIELLQKLDLRTPFNSFVAKKIFQLSYYTFSIGLLSYIAREIARNLMHHGYEIDKLSQFWVDSQAYILMAAVIYIIAVIFGKGIELQNENELTV